MAVFPDRIVLKNSADSQAEIEALIQTGGVDPITQGEIVLGIEPTNVRFYTKAGDGSIVTLGSAAGAISALGDLVDVDLSTTPPTDGQVIAYDAASGNWLPADQTQPDGGLLAVVDDTTPELGGDLYTNQYYIKSSLGDVEIAPASSVLTVRGGPYGDGALKLNCENNSHGVTIKSPPHSVSATYTLTLPDNTGNPDQVLTTDGTGGLSWTDNTGGSGGGGAVNLDDLLDVDAALPVNGQIITWFDDEGKWVNGPVATRWEYNTSEQYADDVSLLMNFNGNLDDAKGLTTSSTGTITYGAGPLNDQAALFNGSSIVEVSPDSSLDLDGDFTIEMWVYPNSATGSFQGLAGRRNFPGPDAVGDWIWYINTTGIIEFADLGNSDYRQTSAGVVGAAWNHVAVTRSNGIIRIFIGGVSRAAFTMGTNFTSTQNLTVGQASTGSYLSGAVSDLRITKGVARYIADFTPPTAPLSLGSDPVATMPLDVLTDVSVPNPTPGQVLGWNNASSRWEAVTPSTSGLPTASDGEALIWQNGAWAPGPMIGGVNYTGGDDDFNDVSLLLHCEGANGSTTFTDSSTNNFTIGVNQQAQISTAQSRFGSGSAYFDGDSDYLQLPSDEKFSMGNGDFTFECFYRPTSRTAQYPRIIQFGSSPWQTNDNMALLDRHDDANTKFSVAIFKIAGNTLILQSATEVVNDTWYHLAVTRNGSTFRLFVDGVEEDTYTSTVAVSDSAAISGYIGGTIEGQSASSNGYVDEVRITKGVARYTSSFTPPTEAFPDTGGQVTIPYSIDNLDDVDTSTTAPNDGQALVWDAADEQWKPGTVAGGGGGGSLNDLTDVTAVSPGDGDALVWAEHLNEWVVGTELVRWVSGTPDPYSAQTVLLMNLNNDLVDETGRHTPAYSGNETYGAGRYGTGSASFDRSNHIDFGQSADFALSGDFTIEFWVNPDVIPAEGDGGAWLVKRYLIGAGSGTWGTILGHDSFEFQDLQNVVRYSSNAQVVAGVWQHIAFTRENNTLRMFLDGVLVGTHSNVTTNFTNSYGMSFGRWDASGGYQYDGLMDDLRVTNGVARYTANFTPPQSQLSLTSNDKTATMPLDVLTDVSAATPAGGQVLGWNASSSVWEPVSATGLPSGQDGAALIWEDGQWVAGPVIGGVDYTPSGTDQYYNSVSLLIRADGTDGSANFTDDGPNALAITAQGNAKISTAEYKFGGSSAFFDGTGDSLSIASDTSLSLDGDFTIEMWVRPQASSRGGILSSINPTAFTSGVSLLLFDHPNAPDAISLWVNDCGTNFLVSSGALNTATWYHIAIVREAGNITLYLNGTSTDTFTCSSTVDFSDGGLSIGSYYGGDFNGYIDDLRITKGLARYTSNFSAPTEALPGGGAAVTIPYSINNLDDVDTSTVAATAGQALVWDDTASLWKPGSQNIQDLNDFELNEGSPWPYDFVWNTKTTPGPTTAGEWGTNLIFWDPTDAEGRAYSATGIMQFWLSSDNATWIELTANIIYFAADDYYYVDGSTLQSTQIDNEGWTSLYLSFTDPTGHSSDYTPLAEGDILQWNAVDQKFKPAQLPSGGGGAANLDDLSDVSAANPADGQGLVWSSGDNAWVKGPELVRWEAANDDPLASDVGVLMNFNGDLTDETGLHTPAMAVGVAQYTTGLYGTQAITFDGTRNLTIGDSDNLDMPSDFTIEFWTKPTTLNGLKGMLIKRFPSDVGAGSWGIAHDGTTWSFRDLHQLPVTNYNSSTALTAGQWQHIAITREGTTLRLFHNGDLTDTFTNVSRNWTNTYDMKLGEWGANITQYFYEGAFEDLRFTQGHARYTASFTPPSEELVLTSTGRQPLMPLDILTDVSTGSAANGNSLVYSAASGMWEPASLALTDLTDVGQTTSPGTQTWQGRWVVNSLTANACQLSGGVGPYDSGINGIIIAAVDDDGVNQTSGLGDAWNNAGSIYYSIDGGTWKQTTLSYSQTLCNPTVYSLSAPELYSDWQGAIAIGQDLFLSDGIPAGTPIDTPDGHVLTWNGADSKWEPAATAKTSLSELTDTSTATAVDGDLLQYKLQEYEVLLPFDTDVSTNYGTGGDLNYINSAGAVIDTSVKKYGAGSLKMDTTLNTRLQFSDSTAAELPADFTIQAWIQIDRTSTGGGGSTFFICSKRTGPTTDHSYSFYYSEANTRLEFGVGTTGSANYFFSDTFTIPDSEWVHVAVVKSGTTLTFYVNGTASGTSTGVLNCSTTIAAFRVGGPEQFSRPPYTWYIDDFAMAKTALYSADFTPSATSEGSWENVPEGTLISKTTLKTEVAAATDFADFQARIAAL